MSKELKLLPFERLAVNMFSRGLRAYSRNFVEISTVMDALYRFGLVEAMIGVLSTHY